MSPELLPVGTATIFSEIDDELFTAAFPDDISDEEARVVAAVLTRGRDDEVVFGIGEVFLAVAVGRDSREDEVVQAAPGVGVWALYPRQRVWGIVVGFRWDRG